ncbi:dethiobiotin synthase [Desulfomarina sp.]
MKKVYCITGIDTDIGKTVAVGLLARALLKKGIRVITQKIAQTGCMDVSDDILAHRQIMGIDLSDMDRDNLTCPYLFPVPCSPHLAAKLDGRKIDINRIRRATALLLEQFDVVLLEGAGGLSVPLTEDFLFVDYLQKEQYPLILVSSPKLGSINHTLNSLELARRRNLQVVALLYNRFIDEDERIAVDSKEIFKKYMIKNSFSGPVIDFYPLPEYRNGTIPFPDFQGVFNEL